MANQDELSNAIQSSDASRLQELASIKSVDNQPATKTFAINATGNLFVASTLNGDDAGLTADAEKAFGQVSVFFAAMTKAIAESTNPKTGKAYSFYDYQAIDAVVKESGLFVQVGQNDINFKSNSWGIQFSTELVQAVLGGFSGDMASVGKALFSMITSMGAKGNSDIKISGSSSKLDSKVGAIIFVCEYLLGAVSISPIVVYIDVEKSKSAFEAGPCFKTEATKTELVLHKEVYLFVPPVFMSQAGTMNEAMANPEFQKLVTQMKADLSGNSSDDEGSANNPTKPSNPTKPVTPSST